MAIPRLDSSLAPERRKEWVVSFNCSPAKRKLSFFTHLKTEEYDIVKTKAASSLTPREAANRTIHAKTAPLLITTFCSMPVLVCPKHSVRIPLPNTMSLHLSCKASPTLKRPEKQIHMTIANSGRFKANATASMALTSSGGAAAACFGGCSCPQTSNTFHAVLYRTRGFIRPRADSTNPYSVRPAPSSYPSTSHSAKNRSCSASVMRSHFKPDRKSSRLRSWIACSYLFLVASFKALSKKVSTRWRPFPSRTHLPKPGINATHIIAHPRAIRLTIPMLPCSHKSCNKKWSQSLTKPTRISSCGGSTKLLFYMVPSMLIMSMFVFALADNAAVVCWQNQPSWLPTWSPKHALIGLIVFQLKGVFQLLHLRVCKNWRKRWTKSVGWMFVTTPSTYCPCFSQHANAYKT